jgi:hypothetical protein
MFKYYLDEFRLQTDNWLYSTRCRVIIAVAGHGEHLITCAARLEVTSVGLPALLLNQLMRPFGEIVQAYKDTVISNKCVSAHNTC